MVNYSIEEISVDRVKFTWTQQGFASDGVKCHTEQGLGGMLEQIKKLAEGE